MNLSSKILQSETSDSEENMTLRQKSFESQDLNMRHYCLNRLDDDKDIPTSSSQSIKTHANMSQQSLHEPMIASSLKDFNLIEPSEPEIDLNFASMHGKNFVSIGLWTRKEESQVGQSPSGEANNITGGYLCNSPLYVPSVLSKPINDQIDISQSLFVATTK